MFGKEENPHRPEKIQAMIDQHREESLTSSSDADEGSSSNAGKAYVDDEGDSDSSSSTSSSHGPLHDQEKNEVVTMLDALIKLKGELEQVVPLLMSGKAIHLDLYDEDFEEFRLDIFVEVSGCCNHYECCSTIY